VRCVLDANDFSFKLEPSAPSKVSSAISASDEICHPLVPVRRFRHRQHDDRLGRSSRMEPSWSLHHGLGPAETGLRLTVRLTLLLGRPSGRCGHCPWAETSRILPLSSAAALSHCRWAKSLGM
jgi:hypothetical protein